MKIAVSAQGREPGDLVDQRFGRAPYFLIYDDENGQFSAIENGRNMDSSQGAGIQAAQHAINQGATVVITGNCGPKAFRVLSAAGIKVACVSGMMVREAVDACRQGELTFLSEANVEGHW